MKNKICVGITSCSDVPDEKNKDEIQKLVSLLETHGFEVRLSTKLFSDGNANFALPEEKAEILNNFFRDPEISEIFDVSGGDLANELLRFIDYDAAAKSKARFWGYSDLTTVINSIYTNTGRQSVLFQPRKIINGRCEEFFSFFGNGSRELFDISVSFLSGEELSGTLVGGNLRCLLKLAGTSCFPNISGKVLLLESLGGGYERTASYITQLGMMGVFGEVSGVLLGTFIEAERLYGRDDVLSFISGKIRSFNEQLAIAETRDIGHRDNSLAAVIGGEIAFKSISPK